ncbi:orotidine-5'-phosphate decarboxylase [SAR86 cluster bacterium]|nr:orotidine-5'-phosphate decarboxylase [SAR86 cluster bacterium]
MTIKINKKQIIVGLDCDTEEEVETILTLLDPNLYRVKVGKQLFMNCGPNIIEKINNFGFEIFLDLKLHDIPNTVSKALQNILKLNIWMTNIHLSGGREMIEASVNKIKEFNNETLLVGVTVLTSLDDKNIEEIGFYRNTEESTLVLAKLGQEIGIDGVVASLNSVSEIKTTFGNDFVTVTPGIRMQQNDEDQKRSGSLFDAIQFGTNFVVVGRELTQAKNKTEVINQFNSLID